MEASGHESRRIRDKEAKRCLRKSRQQNLLAQTQSSPVHGVEGFIQELGLFAIHGHIKNPEM